jgi:DNA adenine methylase
MRKPKVVEPFLKWPGGKRWLVQRYSNLFPTSFRRYFEPFLGGGAVFFHLLPPLAVLSDANPDLINAYQCVKNNPSIIDQRLRWLHARHNHKLYYRMRAKKPRSNIGRAVRFIYLNRSCFNGIYRVNQKGEFNVPIGSKDLIEYPEDYLSLISQSFKKTVIEVVDFEDSIDRAGKDDFIFVDPPYTVMHNNNNFRKYNASLFSWADQKRLAAAVRRAAQREAIIMITNANHQSIKDLYGGFGNHCLINRSSVLAADSLHRCKTTELLVTSYKLKSIEKTIRAQTRANNKTVLNNAFCLIRQSITTDYEKTLLT